MSRKALSCSDGRTLAESAVLPAGRMHTPITGRLPSDHESGRLPRHCAKGICARH